MSIHGKRIGKTNKLDLSGNFYWIITGMPRSGTQNAAVMLNLNGIACAHESFFRYRLIKGKQVSSEISSESSWLSAPFLKSVSFQKCLVLVRHPLSLSRSHYLLKSMEIPPKYPYLEAVYSFLPDALNIPKRLDRILFFYIHWYELICHQLPTNRDVQFISSEYLFENDVISLFGETFKTPKEKINTQQSKKENFGLKIKDTQIEDSQYYIDALNTYNTLIGNT